MTKNPHNVPHDKIIWKNVSLYEIWDFPLKVNIGPSDKLKTEDGRPYICIAELYAPDKCTYHCHPDNFSKICDTAKYVILEGKAP